MRREKPAPPEDEAAEFEIDPSLVAEAEKIIEYARQHRGYVPNHHRLQMRNRGIRRV